MEELVKENELLKKENLLLKEKRLHIFKTKCSKRIRI